MEKAENEGYRAAGCVYVRVSRGGGGLFGWTVQRTSPNDSLLDNMSGT